MVGALLVAAPLLMAVLVNLGVMGFAMIVFMASSNTTLQVTVPDALRGRLMGLYARDRWNLTPKLTLDYGMRWEYFPTPTRNNRGIEFYDGTTNKVQLCGVGSVPDNCGATVSKKLFAPLGAKYL